MTGKTQMGIESSDELGDFLGAQQLLKGHIHSLDEILEEYKKVTLDDLKTLADLLFGRGYDPGLIAVEQGLFGLEPIPLLLA